MANPWYKTATGKAALAGVIPTTLVSLIAIGVSTCLTYKQFSQSAAKDKSDSIRAVERDRQDSLRIIKREKQDSLRVIEEEKQFFLRTVQQYRYDSILNARLTRISKSQLQIAEGEYSIQRKQLTSKELSDIMKFETAADKLAELSNSRSNDLVKNFKGGQSWALEVMSVLKSQLDNPILIENKDLFQEWANYLGEIRYQYWIYEYKWKGFSADTLHSMLGEEVGVFSVLGKVTNDIGFLANHSYIYYHGRLDQYLAKSAKNN